MSTTSMAIFSNPLFATYSVYARNASIVNNLEPVIPQILWWKSKGDPEQPSVLSGKQVSLTQTESNC